MYVCCGCCEDKINTLKIFKLAFKEPICLFKKSSLNYEQNNNNKRPQAKCPPTCEMSVYGEYVYNMYVKNAIRGDGKFPPLP